MSKLSSCVVFGAVMAGCATTTIQSTWTDPSFAGEPFERVAVVALFDTLAESRTFEQTAARALQARGVDAEEAHAILSDDRMYEQDELRARLAEAGVDGILIYRMIAVDERNVYRNPTPYLHMPGGVMFGDPYYWYYYPGVDYYWYWRSTWDVTHSPGYWEPLSFVIVESSLYDAQRNRLVWTARSETMDDSRFDSLADSVVDKVTKELLAMDVVARTDPEPTAAAR